MRLEWKYPYFWYWQKCTKFAASSTLSNWKEEAWKKSGLQRDSNPWPPRYRCDALPTELWSHTLGARSIYWVHISREEWNDVKFIWNDSYLNCGCRCKWRMIVEVNFQFKQLKRRSLKKNQGFNGIRTRDLRDTGAMLYQLSMKPHIGSVGSEVNLFHLQPQYKYDIFHINLTSFHCLGRYELNKLTSLPMCGFIAQLIEHRTGIAEVTI